MAPISGDDDGVVLECREPNLEEPTDEITTVHSEISISTAQISSWDLPSILTHQIVKVKASRTRLIEESSYFQSLLSGNFSEALLSHISVRWSLEVFLHVLRFIHGCHMEVTYCNFVPLYHAGLYFGIEKLILECRTWLADSIVKSSPSSSQLELADLIGIWDFGMEHAIDWILGICTSCVARNFMWAMSCDTFVELPYSFLLSCIKHPHLTVDSERHLCEALLAWVSADTKLREVTSRAEDIRGGNSKQINTVKDDWTNILEEIRVFLLPLWFSLGKCRCCYFSGIAKQSIADIFGLLKGASKGSYHLVNANGWKSVRIRLTDYSKKVDLSGCPQVTSATVVLSLLPQSSSVGPLFTGITEASIDLEPPKWLSHLPTLSFEAMLAVDISKCYGLHLGAAIECFRKSFPALRIIRMTHFLDFETKKVCQLIEKCSSVSEVDLTVDVSPLSSSQVSVKFCESVTKRLMKNYFALSSCPDTPRTVSNITKLTLEGRTDFSDPELQKIAEICVSLCYLNIKGCVLVTDIGIANLILRCRKLHSIIATDTSFGRNSISALCSRTEVSDHSHVAKMDKNHLVESASNLQMLHIGGCKGVDEISLVEVLSLESRLKSLCLRDTCLVDRGLYSFPGSSLEVLDVSNTMISGAALSHMVSRNRGLKHLEVRGCRNLFSHHSNYEEGHLDSRHSSGECFRVLGNGCKLERLAVGWGFSLTSLDAVGPALRTLKSMDVGLGGSLGPDGLIRLVALCPSLESVNLTLQMISDTVVRDVMRKLRNLQVFSISYCMGDLSPLSMIHCVPSLRKLKLERVTPWMTNDDLTLLAQNCANLIELSLVGCTHLDGDSQQIISSGWPGLISLHLEDCGSVTANGFGFLCDCKAMEDLLLRHNGRGIQRNFILDAASKLPMLRSISIDWCDAKEADFDLPQFADRCSLSSVKISRCKLQNCTLEFRNMEAQKRPVHKETLVLVWSSSSLQRAVVKERIT